MVTPPHSPVQRRNPAFPFFNRLLQEGSGHRTSNTRQCPATAPVILDSKPENKRAPLLPTNLRDREFPAHAQCSPVSCNKMAELPEMSSAIGQKEDQAEEDRCPIELKDPPKSKLKRQLSIDTVERTEQQRVHKRIFIRQHTPEVTGGVYADEVDGDDTQGAHASTSRSSTKFIDPPTHHKQDVPSIYVESAVVQSRDHENQRSIMTSLPGISRQRDSPQDKSISCQRKEPGLATYDPVYQDPIPSSPGLPNLAEIGLTSPFLCTTPRDKEGSAFTFPEPHAASPRRVSPYKPPQREISPSGSESSYSHQALSDPYDSKEKTYFTTDPNSRCSRYQQSPRTRSRESDSRDSQDYPSYVSPSGFKWPQTAVVTQATPFSPRVVTAESKPRYPISSVSPAQSASNSSKHHSKEEDLQRLHMLLEERARAEKYYGIPHRDDEYSADSVFTRDVYTDELLRRVAFYPLRNSISCVDRSPNEKELKDVHDDVKNRYERSISLPLHSPKQMRCILQHQLPVNRERGDSLAKETSERGRQPWQADAKRRLFVKSDRYADEIPKRRPLFDQSDVSLDTEPPGIPEEVLEFLHSRNFHPEYLENIKDALLHSEPSTSSQESMTSPLTSRYSRSTSAHYGSAQEDLLQRREDSVLNQGLFRRNFSDRYPDEDVRRGSFGSFRERQIGDINVRLTCESIKQNPRKTDEMLRELDHHCTDGKCSQIEDEIRQMAMHAYSKIRRNDTSPASFNQFKNEINETNTNVYNSMRVLCGIKCLCKYGRTLEEIFPGSVVFTLNCPNIDALLDLWDFYKSGHLEKQLQDAFVTEELLKRFDCSEIKLKISIEWKAYVQCKEELEQSLQSHILSTPTKLAANHARSRSEPASVSKQANRILTSPMTSSHAVLSPFRERFCSDSSVELSPRRAFQEINAGKDPKPPPSPSKKYIPDSVFFPDDNLRPPLMNSPRWRPSGVNAHAQSEQENNGGGGMSLQRQ